MNLGLGNRIVIYKKRKISIKENVSVHRCLNRVGKQYSIKQNGLVVAHTDCIMLLDATFTINKSGQKRVRETKQKNVHAFINGRLALRGGMGVTAMDCENNVGKSLPAKITYNPYKDKSFVCNNLTIKPYYPKGALCVTITKHGCFASYTYK